MHYELLVNKIGKTFRFTQIRARNETECKKEKDGKKKRQRSNFSRNKNRKCSKNTYISTFAKFLGHIAWKLKRSKWCKKIITDPFDIKNCYNMRRKEYIRPHKKVNLAHMPSTTIILTEEFIVKRNMTYTDKLPRHYRPLLGRKNRHKILIQRQILAALKNVYLCLKREEKTLTDKINTSLYKYQTQNIVESVNQLIYICERAKNICMNAIARNKLEEK